MRDRNPKLKSLLAVADHPAFFVGVLVLAVGFVNYDILNATPLLACLEPDSWGYVTTNTLRTQGDQLFLSGIHLIFGDLRWGGPIQLNAMLLSYVAVAFAVRRLFRSNAAGLAVAASLMLSAQLYAWYPKIMAEALFITLIGFHLTAVIYLLDAYSDRWAVAAGVTLAAMVLVRPNGVSFLLGIPVLVILLPKYWRRLLLLGIGPAVIAVVAQATLNYYQQDFFGLTVFTGPQLVATYGELITADMPSQYPELAAALEARLRPLYAKYPPPDERSFPFGYAAVAASVVTPAQYQYAWPEMTSYVAKLMPDASSTARAQVIDRIGTSLAISAIAHNPVGFLKDVGSSFADYWATQSLYHSSGLNQIAAWCYDSSKVAITGNDSGTFARVLDFTPYSQPETARTITVLASAGPRLIERPWLWFQRLRLRYLVMAVTFVVSLVGLASLLVKRPPGKLLGLWAYLGINLQGGYLVLSLANASFSRYASPLDVVVMVTFMTFVIGLWNFVAVRMRRRWARARIGQDKPDALSTGGA